MTALTNIFLNSQDHTTLKTAIDACGLVMVLHIINL